MKIRKAHALGAACLCLLLSSCDPDNDYPANDLKIYQQYEVFIQDGSKAAFANFYLDAPGGMRFRLTGDAKVTVNDVNMLYSPSISETSPEFNYAAALDMTDERAIFRFYRSHDTMYTNSVSFADMAYITMTDLSTTISNGQAVAYTVNGAIQPDDKVAVTLVPTEATTNARIYTTAVSPFSNTFTCTDVPAGKYNVRLDVVRTVITTANDGIADGGVIRIIRRKTATDVTVN